MSFLDKLSFIFSDDEISQDECFLALDIGTSSVKAAVFKIKAEDRNKSPIVVINGAGKALLKADGSLGGNLKEFARACEEAKKEAENMAGIKTEKTICGLSGPFIKGYSNFEDYKRDEPDKPIDLSEIKHAIQKLQWRVYEKIRKKEQEESGVLENQIKILSGRIIGVKIDGYKVADPLGFRGQELCLNILNIFCLNSTLKFLEELEKRLQLKFIYYACEPFAIFEAIANKFFKTADLNEIAAVCIDFGGRVTDISLFQQGFFEGPKTVSVGGNSFTRRLSKKLNLTLKEADEIKLRYTKGQLSPLVKRRITGVLSSDLKIWLQGVEDVLTNFSSFGNFPSQILLCGGASVLSGVQKAIKDEKWQDAADFAFFSSAKLLSAADIIEVEDKTNLFNSLDCIAILALSRSVLELVKKQSAINSVLFKIIRLMQT